jgi:hypothetical protein
MNIKILISNKDYENKNKENVIAKKKNSSKYETTKLYKFIEKFINEIIKQCT